MVETEPGPSADMLLCKSCKQQLTIITVTVAHPEKMNCVDLPVW
jgi:hypothetical protein